MFGKTAREAYELMIDMVSRAESTAGEGPPQRVRAGDAAGEPATAAETAPIIRGAAPLRHGRRRARGASC